jgi:hypothetical protein
MKKKQALPHKPKQRLTPLAKTLLEVTTPLLKHPNTQWAQVCLQWGNIVGEVWAGQTCPTRLVFPTPQQPRGTLHVATWSTDAMALSYEAPYMCEKVNQYLGFGGVHQIKWRRIAKPFPQDTGPKRRTPPVALTPSEEAWVAQQMVDHTSSRSPFKSAPEELQEALTALGATLVQHEKITPQRHRHGL